MNFDQSILYDFTVQAKEHLETFESDLLNLEQNADNPDAELINQVFRVIHSIKGGSGFLGLTTLKDLTHVMETLLSMMRAGDIRPENRYVDALLQGVDLIGTMLDDIENSNDVDVSEVLARLNQLLADDDVPAPLRQDMSESVSLAAQDGASGSFEISKFTFTHIPEKYEYLFILRYDLTDLAQRERKSPMVVIRDLLQQGEILDGIVQEFGEKQDGLPTGPLIYDALYATWLHRDFLEAVARLPQERIIPVDKAHAEALLRDQAGAASPTGSTPDPAEAAVEPVADAAAEQAPPPAEEFAGPVELEDEPAAVAEPTKKTPGARSKSPSEVTNTVRISVSIIDRLMTLAGELVLMRNRFLLIADKSDPASRSIAHGLDIVTTELQESVMATRLQPIGNVFGKFVRVVRDMSRDLHKRIEIEIIGSEVEIDKTIVDGLGDPMTHLVRNSCDHGIETPEARKAAGKPEAGHITLRAYHEGGQINIEIRDDGKGLDPALIRRRALEKGLKSETELSDMSDKEIISLLFLPGFSTAEKISDISGRGVGLDVVRTGIEKLGGTVEIESTVGQGTTFSLRLPLTLAIIPCLIVRADQHRYAIPQVNVDELVCLYDDEVFTKVEYAGDREVYRLRGRLLPMVRFNEVLARAEVFTDTTRAEIIEHHQRLQQQARTDVSEQPDDNDGAGERGKTLMFAVLKVGNERYGLIVNQILGTEEIVVKPMHPAVKSLRCYSGATVMGDGKVAMIVDVDGVANHAGIGLDTTAAEDVAVDDAAAESATQAMLLFKVGPEEQFAVDLGGIQRIERIRKSEMEHVGTREFVPINGESIRVLRLESLLQVSPCVDAEDLYLLLPKNTSHPYGVLISSLVDIEQAPAQVSDASYAEEGILGSEILRDKMTLYLDLEALLERAERQWPAVRLFHAEASRNNYSEVPGQVPSEGLTAAPAEEPAVLSTGTGS